MTIDYGCYQTCVEFTFCSKWNHANGQVLSQMETDVVRGVIPEPYNTVGVLTEGKRVGGLLE
jgi:hypothetical protein